MIPYIEFYTWRVGPIPLHPFGPLIAIACVVGWKLAKYRATTYGYDVKKFASFTWWMTVTGFVCGHVLDEIAYHPEEMVRAPWTLFMLWKGLSSYGGFIGAIIGGFAWKFFEIKPGAFFPSWRAKAEPVLMHGDIFCSTYPVAWIFGRLGCTLVHDHPGARAALGAFLSVAYGPGPVDDYGIIGLHHGIEPRYDLGFLELLFTIVLATAFALTWRIKKPLGLYIVAVCILYAPVRFFMDFLRLEDGEGGDVRYLSLTPAQWSCIAMFVFGALFSLYVRARIKAGTAYVTGADAPAKPTEAPDAAAAST